MKKCQEKDQKNIDLIKEHEPEIKKQDLCTHPLLIIERRFLPGLIFEACQKFEQRAQKHCIDYEKKSVSKFQNEIVEIALGLNINVPAKLQKNKEPGNQDGKLTGVEGEAAAGKIEFESHAPKDEAADQMEELMAQMGLLDIEGMDAMMLLDNEADDDEELVFSAGNDDEPSRL